MREYHFLRALGALGEVSYLFFRDPAAASPSLAELPFCREVIPVEKPALYTPGKVMRGILSGRPLPVVNYSSPLMSAALSTLMRERKFDFAHFDTIHMNGYESLVGDLPILYDWHNIESEAMRRFGQLSTSAPRRLYALVTARKLAALENQILRTAAGHVVCSEREKDELTRWNSSARIAVVENGVDTSHYSSPPDDSRHRNRLVFVGSMSYHANADAAIDFARNTWPAVRDRFPSWQLSLVGSDPGPAVRELAALPGVEVTGTVPDVKPYYANAIAAIVPLRTGGGTRLKILEAMAAGVPVISTALGAEGLAALPGKDFLLAESRDWLPQLERLASEPGLRDRLARSGLDLVRSRYDWDLIGQNLCRTYVAWLS